ncbi:MAG: hypothetical protein AB2A00_19005 [Myxococcota bacterium]
MNRVAACLLVGGMALCSGCRTSGSVPEKAPPPEKTTLVGSRWALPESLADAVAKERLDTPLVPVTVNVAGASYALQVPAAAPPVVTAEPDGGTSLDVVLDDGVTGHCTGQPGELRLGSLVLKAHRHLVDAAVGRRHVTSAITPLEGLPSAISVAWEYITDDDTYGAYRLLAGYSGPVAWACTVDSPGHQATLARLLGELMRGSLRGDEATQRTYYAMTSGQGMRAIGVEERVTQADQGALERDRVLFLRPASGGLFISDYLQEETSNAGEAMVDMRIGSWVQGELNLDVKVHRADDGKLTVSGVREGKAMNGSVESLTFQSAAQRRRVVRDLVERGHDAVMLDSLDLADDPEATPLAEVVREELVLIRRTDDWALLEATPQDGESNSVSLRWVDRHGDMIRSEWTRGSIRVVTEITWPPVPRLPPR